MSKSKIVLLIGSLFTAVGAFLCLRADSLATRWQPLGDGAWGGTTDPAARHSYESSCRCAAPRNHENGLWHTYTGHWCLCSGPRPVS